MNIKRKEIEKKFNNYCELNEECNRICPTGRYMNCFIEFLTENYNITEKKEEENK